MTTTSDISGNGDHRLANRRTVAAWALAVVEAVVAFAVVAGGLALIGDQ